jgi:hypothetical protein
MNEGLEKLRAIGAQKIHERTHITQRYIQAILYESFDGIAKVQLMGFISILEREYQVDLSDVRENAKEYFASEALNSNTQEAEYKKELLGNSTKRYDIKKIIIAVAVVVVVVVGSYVGYMQISDTSADSNTTKEVLQKSVKSSPVANIEDENLSQSQKDVTTQEAVDEVTPQKEQKEKEEKKEVIQKSLRIIPRTKVWMGYIDLETGKKKQTVTKGVIELDPNKTYLLTFGHGYIDIDINGELKEFKNPKKVKFLYKDGELEQIDNKTFRFYNKGKLW